MEKLDAILTKLEEIRAALADAGRTNQVLSAEEAANYCGFEAIPAFQYWLRRIKERPPIKGRYPRPLLDAWLARECRMKAKKKR